MGWNQVFFEGDDPICAGLSTGIDQFYFVHSYYVAPQDADLTLFESDYGGRFVSGIRRGRCYATQFHPEKSQAKGLQLYGNFLRTL
jgi:glutamine amidotransferase